MTRLSYWLAILGLLASAAVANAHEARPAYLELQQVDADHYDVLWKVPGLGEDQRLALHVDFAEDVAAVGKVRRAYVDNSFTDRWRVRRAGGLEGSTIRIDGLASTLTDVLVRLERLDGTTQTLRVMPASPEFVIATAPGRWDVARTYLGLGVEHILLGIDHLLFVLALVILVDGARRLFWTITAFTAAHSITLAAATLGWIHVPSPPVEAIIALSIVFLASEILHARAGRPGLTYGHPWLVAFAFGLLHGLGFAGALAEIGLPQNAIPVALLCFNVGVEVGQLLFVGAMLALFWSTRAVHARWDAAPRWIPALRPVPVYAIGAVASFWTIERVVAFWA